MNIEILSVKKGVFLLTIVLYYSVKKNLLIRIQTAGFVSALRQLLTNHHYKLVWKILQAFNCSIEPFVNPVEGKVSFSPSFKMLCLFLLNPLKKIR